MGWHTKNGKTRLRARVEAAIVNRDARATRLPRAKFPNIAVSISTRALLALVIRPLSRVRVVYDICDSLAEDNPRTRTINPI